LPEWITERGIGETRFALVDGQRVLAAKIHLHGAAVAGLVLPARIIAVRPQAIARDEEGTEYLLPKGTSGANEGEQVDIVVTRSTIPGSEPWKRPLARPALDGEGLTDPVVAGAIGTIPDEWNDIVEEARTGLVGFAGGELRLSPTPAMTLIDVDGTLPAKELALAGASAAARAVLRLDIGGSIGIDLPTIAGKADRQAVGEMIDAILPKPFERTAMNGFGFVQIIRPRRRASLIELAQDRAAFEARALLRRVGSETGAVRLVAHPAVVDILERQVTWLEELGRRIGGAVGLRADAAIAMSGGYAEPV
jgi:hypothetical protein